MVLANPILSNSGQTQQDCLPTLILNLLIHFVGRLDEMSIKNKEILMNLRCPTLSDFRWYKDTFLSKLFQLDNYTQTFWKKKLYSAYPNSSGKRLSKNSKTFMEHLIIIILLSAK